MEVYYLHNRLIDYYLFVVWSALIWTFITENNKKHDSYFHTEIYYCDS